MTETYRPHITLIHDWLLTLRGGEKVLAELCKALPKSDILTLLHTPGASGPDIAAHDIRASFLNALPGVRRYYRHLLPLMPLAIGTLDASKADLVVSVSHCVAKGVGGRRKGQFHVCLCLTPMRYIWDIEADYRRRLGLAGMALRIARPFLRAWDRRSAQRVDLFIAISACVAERIRRVYGRPSAVLYPPADVDFYTPSDVPREDFYLVVSALTPYKQADQAIAAARITGRRIKVIGTGTEYDRLKSLAGDGVELLGWQSDEVIRDHYRRCRALLFPQLEDFGIVPVEAMACGASVIAFAGGGAKETVLDAANPAVPNPTGLLYAPQTAEALAEAIRTFEKIGCVPIFKIGTYPIFSPSAIRAWAETFSPQRFREGFLQILQPHMAKRGWETKR